MRMTMSPLAGTSGLTCRDALFVNVDDWEGSVAAVLSVAVVTIEGADVGCSPREHAPIKSVQASNKAVIAFFLIVFSCFLIF